MKKTNIKTEWNLGLYYKSPDDSNIERDLVRLENLCADFAEKYKLFESYRENISKVAEGLEAFEKVEAELGGAKPLMYFQYRMALNTQEMRNQSEIAKGIDRLTKAHNKTLFFPLSLGKIPAAFQEKYLSSLELKEFRYCLTVLFKESKHHLSEPEEKIMNLKSLPAHSLWIQAQEKILYSNSVPFKGKEIPLAEAQFKISALKTKDRHALHNAVVSVYKKTAPFAEAEINAVYTDKKIDDALRNFKKPYSSTVLSCQNDENAVEKLVKTVTDAFSTSHDFYALKKKLLKLPKLGYADRSAKIGEVKRTFSFEESVELVRAGFGKVDKQFVDLFDRFLANGQIDVFPKKGKEGGAFCSGTYNQPTFVFLNHVNTFDSMRTLAHEMGHAIHTEFSKKQRPMYQSYTTSTAEVASTLFENFAFEEVFEKLTPKEKIIALHDRVQDDISTIFRQIACFNFELELHNEIRTKGALSHEDIARLHNKHMSAYLGTHFKLSLDDGYFFVSWSHIRRFFYVYSYSYGELVSKVLYRRFKEDKKYVDKLVAFLSAGGSMSPEDIFKTAGIDTSKPDFINEGLAEVKQKIKELELLTKS